MSGFVVRIKSALCAITVEPLAFFHSLSMQMSSVAMETGMYQVICNQLFYQDDLSGTPGNPTTVDCQNLSDQPWAENQVQQASTYWHMATSLARLLPSLITYVLLGAWGDKHGRKINILLGICNSILGVLPLMLLFRFPLRIPMWSFVCVQFLLGLTGSIGLVFMSCWAYLADIVTDKRDLTTRMVILGMVSSIAGIIGSSLASQLMNILTLNGILLVGQALNVVGFVYILFRMDQSPPSKVQKNLHKKSIDAAVIDERVEHDDETPLIKDANGAKCCTHFRTCLRLVHSVWVTYTRKRPGRNRTYLLLLTSVYGVYLLGEMGKGSVVTLFVFRSPFSWDGQHLGYYKSLGSVTTLLGSMIGVIVLKRICKFRDTTVLILATLSAIASLLDLGLSTTDWQLYMAPALSCLSVLFMPTIKSFTSQLVDQDEVGKSFVAYMFTADAAIIVNVVASNFIYNSTVNFFPGFLFLLCAGLLFIVFIVLCWIHRDLGKSYNSLLAKPVKVNGHCDNNDDTRAINDSG